ncbi:2848_t:CDS:2 [Gigaspora margarita]|uniref:2848_t:CDS:1 n=1 Tax=Gigaspora margarita TaxID=4874 RepID=A0ABM8VVV5_GIGMA|nr:2848_t:CDS:2 [Gigaspora margarita]
MNWKIIKETLFSWIPLNKLTKIHKIGNDEFADVNAEKDVIENINSDAKHKLSTDVNQNQFARAQNNAVKAHDINYLLNEVEKAGVSTEPMEYEETTCEKNQFTPNPTDMVFKTLISAAEESEMFVPFAPLIEIFLKLGEDIVILYLKAEHNKVLCNYLTKRVNSAVAAINDLEIRKQDNQEFFKDAANLQLIKDFVKCMLDMRKFVAEVSQLGSFGTFFNSNNIIQKYKDLSNRFDGYLNSLNFAMNRDWILYLQKIHGDTNDSKTLNGETIKQLESLIKDAYEVKKTDLEQYQANIIKKDLKEMKKFLHELSDSNKKNTLANIKRIRDLNVSYQRTEVPIKHQSFLNYNDYEPKFDIPPRGKTIHCRWNNIFLLHYAFKEIPQITEDQKKDLSQQVAILKELKDSEHIIRFYGIAVSSDETKFHLVTEWMENGNLRDYYKNHKLDWNKRFEFAIDICRGIAFLNAVEILHHDIRGANILINKDHKAKIANFGLSRRFGDITRNIQVNLENVRYMAPEKLEHGDKKRYNVKCEIYSLGALLWEIAEEEIPYTRLGIDLQTIRDKVVKEKYREPFSSTMCHDRDFRPTIAKIFSTLYEYHHKDEKKEPLSIGDEFEDAFILDDFDNIIISVDQAIEEHRKSDGNKQKAWESFKYHAELGDIMAKYWVGYYLYHSILPEHKENRQANLQHAAILFKEAADHGKVEAQLRYGFCLWQGDGVPVNWDEAMRYIKLAADNGNPTAMYNVGAAYWIGKGVIKDQEEGSKYLKMAAKKDQHNAIAICKKLGITY